MKKDIILAGVGGQGILTIATIIGDAAANAGINLKLPLGFGRDFGFDYRIRYRGFVGDRKAKKPLGTEVLESYEHKNPVWVFPQAGEKYHTETIFKFL